MMASGETPPNGDQKVLDDWRVEEPEEAKYNFSDEKGVWQPKPEDILSLFEKLAGGGPLPLKWQCPGRRPPKSKEEVIEENTKEQGGLEKEEEKEDKPRVSEASAFDFDEFSGDPNTKLTPIRAPGGTGRTPRAKRRACMDDIMDSLRKQHLQTVAEREARRAKGSPSGTPKSRIFGMKRSAVPSPTLAVSSAATTASSSLTSVPPVTDVTAGISCSANVPSSSQPSGSSLMSELVSSNTSLSSAGVTAAASMLPMSLSAVTGSGTTSSNFVSSNAAPSFSTTPTTVTLAPISEPPLLRVSEQQTSNTPRERADPSLEQANQSQTDSQPEEASGDNCLPVTTALPPATPHEMAPVVAQTTQLSTFTTETAGPVLSSTTALKPEPPPPADTAESSQPLSASQAIVTTPTLTPASNTDTKSTPPALSVDQSSAPVVGPATSSSSFNPKPSVLAPKTTQAVSSTPPPPPPPLSQPSSSPPVLPPPPLSQPSSSPPVLPPPYTVTIPILTTPADSVSATPSTSAAPQLPPPPPPVTVASAATTDTFKTTSHQPPNLRIPEPGPIMQISKPSTTAIIEPLVSMPEPGDAQVEKVQPDLSAPENKVDPDTGSGIVAEKS